MTRTCEIDGCDGPHFGQGYCNLHYWRLVRKPKKEQRMATCVWCGERKPIGQMRHPNSSRGKTPSTCHACRENNPNEGWCDYHGEPHERSRFTSNDRPIGIEANCVQVSSIKASRARGHAPIHCVTCGIELESWNFRGGRKKCPNCRTCEAAHPSEHWCLDCSAWKPKGMFAQTGKDGKFITVRCRPCRTAHGHGVTVAHILELQGSAKPECAACGSEDFLKVDHDHACCPTGQGCENCVRGYLCHECNTAEGLLHTSARVRLLAAYMDRFTQANSGTAEHPQ